MIDVFFMMGPLDVFRQYIVLTGMAPLPQINSMVPLMTLTFGMI